MGITQAQLDLLNSAIAQGEIFTGCTKPVADFTKFTFTAGVPAGGASVGMTNGPAVFKYAPTYAGVNIEQTMGEVAPRIQKEAVTLSFTCAEDTAARIKLACTNGTLVNTPGATNVPTTDVLYVGGQILGSTPTCVVLVSKTGSFVYMGTTVGLYEWVGIYSAIVTDGYEVSFKLGETRMVKLTMTAYADVTRGAGDQFFQHGFMTTPS